MSAPTLHENWHERLIRLNKGWDSYNGNPITRAALDAVGSFSVVPCSDGGVQLEVHRDGFDIEICIGADGRIESVVLGREMGEEMSNPRLITQRGLIREVADKWAAAYTDIPADDWKCAVLPQLMALDLDVATVEDVRAIIGNDSWTDIRCSQCGKYVTEAVQVGEEPDYESASATMCRDCMAQAFALFPAGPLDSGAAS